MNAGILIMEDNAVLAAQMEEVLCRAGYRCKVTDSVRHAVRLIRQVPPDAVIADYHVCDGTALDLLRGLPENAAPPVVIATATPNAVDPEARRSRHVQAILEKPLADDELLNAAGTCIGRQAGPQSHPKLVCARERQLLLTAIEEVFGRVPSPAPRESTG